MYQKKLCVWTLHAVIMSNIFVRGFRGVFKTVSNTEMECFAKRFILVVRRGSEYTVGFSYVSIVRWKKMLIYPLESL